MKEWMNRKSKRSKIIALWLAFVMLLTPLMSYADGTNGTKADEIGANMVAPVSYTVEVPAIKLDTQHVDGGSGIYYFPVKGETDNIYYHKAAAYLGAISVKLGNVTADLTGAMTVSGNAYADFSYDVAIVKYASDASVDTLIPVATMESRKIGAEESFADTEKAAIYVCTSGTDGDDTEYSLQRVYTIVEETTDFVSADWNATTVPGTDYVANASISATGSFVTAPAGNDIYLGCVKYAYSTEADTVPTEGWSQSSEYTFPADGTYYGYVGYFATAESTDCLDSVALAAPVKIDKTAPTISNVYFYGPSGEITGDAIRRNTDAGFSYVVEASDATTGIKNMKLFSVDADNNRVDVGDFVYDSDSGKYICALTDFQNPEMSYVVRVSDKVGNKSDLAQVPGRLLEADHTKATLDYKWDDSVKNSVLDGSFADGDNTTHTLILKAETYSPIDRLFVRYIDKNGTQKNIRFTTTEETHKLALQSSTPDAYFVYHASISLPEEVLVNELLGSVGVWIYVEGQATPILKAEDLGTALYDQTKPAISWDSSSVKPFDEQGNPDWYNVSNAADYVVTIDGKKYVKVFPSIKDAQDEVLESGIAETSYAVNGSSAQTLDLDTDGVGTILVSESETIDGTAVVVKAVDKADNQTKKNYKFLVDVTKPVILNEDIVFTNNTLSYSITDTIAVSKRGKLTVKTTDNLQVMQVKYSVSKAEAPTVVLNSIDKIPATAQTEYTSTVALSTLLGADAESGNYIVKITSTDYAGNVTTKRVDFSYDVDAPEVIYSLVSKNATDTWDLATKVKEKELYTTVNGYKVLYINTDKDTKDYAFKVAVKDANITKDEVLALAERTLCTLDKENITVTNSGVIFYLIINKDKLTANSANYVGGFVIKDKLGNSSEATDFSPMFRAADTQFILNATLCDSEKEAVTLTNSLKKKLEAGTNKKYFVHISASSSNKIVAADIFDGAGNKVGTLDSVEKDNELTLKKRYYYEAYISLAAKKNIKYSDLYVKASDNDGNEDTVSLLTLLYDKTAPVIVSSDDHESAFAAPVIWQKRAYLDFMVLSGKEAVESDLSAVHVSISDGINLVEKNIKISSVEDKTAIPVKGIAVLPSLDISGTKVTVSASDVAGNVLDDAEYTYFVDATKPVIDSLLINDEDTDLLFKDAVEIKAQVTDLALKSVSIDVTYPDGKTKDGSTVTYEENEGLFNKETQTYAFSLAASAPDGVYQVLVTAVDKAGNISRERKSFELDNSKPKLELEVSEGKESEKSDEEAVYYSSAVVVRAAYTEPHFAVATVTDNGEPVDVTFSGENSDSVTFSVKEEGEHVIEFVVTDSLGHKNKKQLIFVIDTVIPTMKFYVNDEEYQDEELYLDKNAVVRVEVADDNLDLTDLNYKISGSCPDGSVTKNSMSDFERTSETEFEISEEGNYKIAFYAVDLAGNPSETEVVTLRVDKKTPELEILGVEEGEYYNEEKTVQFVMDETFFEDAELSISISRKLGDNDIVRAYKNIHQPGVTLADIIDGKYTYEETFSESGAYSITYIVTDKVGHEAKETISFVLDFEAPIISFAGVENDAYVSGDVNFTAEVLDAFDRTKAVTIEGTVTYENGETEDIDFGTVNSSASPTVIRKLFTEDGEYNITVYATDQATNHAEASIHFIIDTKNPAVKLVGLERSKDGIDWERIEQDITEDGYYYVNKSEGYQFRYLLHVKDANLKEVVSDDDRILTNIMGTNYYVYDVNNDDITEKPLIRMVAAIDELGHSTDVELTPYLIETDLAIKIEATLYDGNTLVSFEDLNAVVYTNRPYDLVVNAQSGYFINKIELLKATQIMDTYSKVYEEDRDQAIQYDSLYKIYKTGEVRITIPANTNINEYFKNLTVRVTDKVTSEEQRIGNVFYDATEPVVLNLEGDEITVDRKWHNAYSLGFWLSSGLDEVEASLIEASYSYDDGAGVDLSSAIINGEVRGTLDVPESKAVAGTKIIFNATDASGNTLTKNNEYLVKVDKTSPVIANVLVNGNGENKLPLAGTPIIETNITDNFTIHAVEIEVTYPDGSKKYKKVTYEEGELEKLGTSAKVRYAIEIPDGQEAAMDGDYKVAVFARDEAMNEAEVARTTFRVDNTVPVVTNRIVSGTMGGKRPLKNFDGTDRDYYYRSNVGVELTYEEVNPKEILVTDNGAPVNVSWTYNGATGKYQTIYYATTEEKHVVKITASDLAGHEAKAQSIEFVIDKTAPTLSFSLNGAFYSEGVVDLMTDATVGVTVSDQTVDSDDLNYQVGIARPDQAGITSDFVKTGERTFTYTEEADYTINFYAVDMAGNVSDTRGVSFRVDKNGPELSITPGSGAAATATAVTFTIREAFWWDATGTINIYRKAGDGVAESLYKTIAVKPTAGVTSISESLSETGIYRMEMEAHDRVGHTATTNGSFTIDCDKPVIRLSGAENYEVTDKTINFLAEIEDAFFASKKVTIEGTRIDISGNKNKITFSAFSEQANPTRIAEIFAEDGIYDIAVSAIDSAGNSDSAKLHFTIDKTDPLIGDLSKYDGTLISKFDFDEALDDLVTDLTVCDIHMYLNGSEYDGTNEIEDGAYTMLISAEDEMHHYVEKSVSFVLDTKGPVFIVTGVEDGEVKNEVYSIDISLQLEEDTLEAVFLNGEAVSVKDNAAHIDIAKKGDYTLTMNAIDGAGNKSTSTITFRYGEKTQYFLWIILAICAILVIGSVVLIVVTKKRKNN